MILYRTAGISQSDPHLRRQILQQSAAQWEGKFRQRVKLGQEGSLFDLPFPLPNLPEDGFTDLFPVFHTEVSPHGHR